jgi:leucyl/phenylalanyl-tRNA--protein transferase
MFSFHRHLDHEVWFPPPLPDEPDGLIAVGGDLLPQRLIHAYANGIFPWFLTDDGDPVWFSPPHRMVLYPQQLHISRSMRKELNSGRFEYRENTDFVGVMNGCAATPRPGQPDTWITPPFIRAYTLLHRLGYAHSAETWLDGELVGGMYGVRIGRVFCGESMFMRVTNASKFAFINKVLQFDSQGIDLLDCQVYSDHVASLGASLIPRQQFLEVLKQL